MSHRIFAIPNFEGTAVDHVLCNVGDPNSRGVVHYAYTVGAEEDVLGRRMFPWAKVRDFAGESYGERQPEIIRRLQSGNGYRPGEGVLDADGGPSMESAHDTIMRLGALELLANLSSGRLSTTDKDPFPHQLALQQYIREPPRYSGLRRILIADEVGLGKTIEAGLILRDILLARGRLDGFRCLYLTMGGLVDDAAEKLRDVLSGIVDGQDIVGTVDSFRNYGRGNTLGVHVASMHAARLYADGRRKSQLPESIRPDVIIIDECHHAASDGDLAGVEVRRPIATQTYMAAQQLLAGQFWTDSRAPQLGILMSATPFRSRPQFVNLLRLLTHSVDSPEGTPYSAYGHDIQARELRSFLQHESTAASVVWRRQSDEEVRSWSGNRIFPNLTVERPHHAAADDSETPQLQHPSGLFLELLSEIKRTVVHIARAHNQGFGGFAIAQLEKKLTSSSIAGACWLFSWAVRHSSWETQDAFKEDKSGGTEGLRNLIRRISQRIADYNPQSKSGYANVRFPSDRFEFPAKSLAQVGSIVDIQKYSRKMREDALEASNWVASDTEITRLVHLAGELLELAGDDDDQGGAEDAKLKWLNAMLERYPEDRFLLFTESLQTCETLQGALGSTCRLLVGSMSKADRNQAVADLQNPRMNARVLVATSAADEGFDLQVACRVIHWDLSSSPATLMQRNGRVARLGQVSDVVAYYLIIAGTHEERRDSALQAKFADMGIDDEALKSRILGSLTEEDEERLEQAIAENEEGVVGNILSRAKSDNEEMDRQLSEIQTTLEYSQVLSREDLADRLEAWQQLGLPDAATDGVRFEFDRVQWERPVFAEVSRMEAAESRVAHVTDSQSRQDLVFDTEFLVFGPRDGGREYRLAGLPPWINDVTHHERHRIVPYTRDDLLGRLLQGFARLSHADFLSIPARRLSPDVQLDTRTKWLLFCTHPLREEETVHPPGTRPFLTWYEFPELEQGELPEPLNDEGADAKYVHEFICCAEKFALADEISDTLSPDQIAAAKQAGTRIQEWVESVTQLGAATFLEEAKYFVPIPIALVHIER